MPGTWEASGGGTDDGGGGSEAAVVTVRGELDMKTAPDVRRQFSDQLRAHPAGLIADLDRVTFCASAGLRVLAEVRTETVVARIPFAVVTAERIVLRALEVSQLDAVLTVCPTVGQARAWIRAQPTV
jgi:anti-sigma B factor antagonist